MSGIAISPLLKLQGDDGVELLHQEGEEGIGRHPLVDDELRYKTLRARS